MCIIALGENSKIHDQTLTKLFFLPQILTQNKKEQGAARKKSRATTPKKKLWDF